MNLDEAFPSKYLKASDLPDEGSEAFTISAVTIDEVGQDKDKKLVISFEGEDKGIICNKTNSNTIAKITGSRDTDDWVGQVVNLYRAEVPFKGEMVEAIRVRLSTPKKSTAKSKHTADAVEGEDPF